MEFLSGDDRNSAAVKIARWFIPAKIEAVPLFRSIGVGPPSTDGVRDKLPALKIKAVLKEPAANFAVQWAIE